MAMKQKDHANQLFQVVQVYSQSVLLSLSLSYRVSQEESGRHGSGIGDAKYCSGTNNNVV